jgi:hypothetical protein
MRLVVPVRVAKLIFIALETQLLSQFAILVFQSRCRMLQFPQLVENFINLLLLFAILEVLSKLVKFLRDFASSLRNSPSSC